MRSVGLHRHFGCDPAAKRRTDQNHVAKIERVEQIEIEIGEIVDSGELRRRRRRAKPGMCRRDETEIVCERLNEPRLRIQPSRRVAAMKKQKRPAIAGFGYLQRNAGDFHAGCAGDGSHCDRSMSVAAPKSVL